MARSSLAFLCLTLLSTVAHAEPSAADQARAEALFDEGKRLMDEQRFAEACPRLEESLRIEEAGGTLAALALCHQGQGRTATAWAEFKALLAMANRTGHEARKALAEESIRKLEPELIWLLIEVNPSASAQAGLEVSLDGKALGRASWGIGLPVDPGAHRLEARAPGFAAWSQPLTLGPKPERRSVTVPALVPLAPAAASSSASTAVAPPPSSPPILAEPAPRNFTPSLVVGGLGVASLLVGGYFGISALSLQKKADEVCPQRGCEDDTAIKQSQDASRNAWISNVGVGLGLVGLTAAYLLLPPAVDRSVGQGRVQLRGVAGAREGGLLLRGAF